MAFNTRERNLLIITMLCVGILVGDKMIFTPLWNAWAERSDRISVLEKQWKEDQSLAKSKQSLEKIWRGMLDSDLPNDTSTAEDTVLMAIGSWSRASRLPINSLRPSWNLEGDEELPKLDCRISGVGDLRSVVSFIYEMEKDTLGIRVEKIDLTSRDDSGNKISIDLHISCLMLEGSHEQE